MKSQHPHFTAPCPAIEARIDAILHKLSLDAKIDLLGGQPEPKAGGDTFGNNEAGIPPLKFADASVGIHWWTTSSTTYPATIALAATWDRDLAYRTGAALGRDARARGVHVVLGPGVNLYRSPLCGRNFEYLGEDPALASISVTAFIRGMQDQGVAATVKHFAVNYQEYDRHNVSSDVDERTLREVYLPAFRAAIEDAGAGAIMTAYNLVNSVHASEHTWLLREVLKGEWGFLGLAMSDWVSTYSAVNAANAGLDLEMPTAKWMNREHLLPAVQNGLVDETILDDKVRRLLRLMCCFGWLDHPQASQIAIETEDARSAEIALEVARRACVLLKNNGGLLPLDPRGKGTIALIGPFAEATPIGGGGSAYNKPWRTVSILDGMRQVFGQDRVCHEPGVLPDNSAAAFANSRFFTPEGESGLKAEYFGTPDWRGAPVMTRIEPHLDQRWGSGAIAEGMDPGSFSARWTGYIRPEHTGKHLMYQSFGAPFRVRFDGQILFDLLDGANLKEPRVVLDLKAGQNYAFEVLYRGHAGFNAACVGWTYQPVEELRKAAVDAARTSDAVVFCCGHSALSEGEGFDRDFAMPAEQEALLLAVAAVNPNVAVVLTAGGAVDMRRWLDRVPALLHAWYPGQEGGRAVAEILAGAVNPSGRLPATFERSLEDRSSHAFYHDSDGDKRVLLGDGLFIGYRHHDRNGITPLFPFGFGLSYTDFAYETLSLPGQFPARGTIEVTVGLRNTGSRSGIEVVQLYLRDREASAPRPVKELKAFASVEIEAGAQRVVTLTLNERDLSFFCPKRRRWVVEPGVFDVLIGASASDIRLTGSFCYGLDAASA